MIANLDTLLEQIREYNQLKSDILENIESLTEEEIEGILVDVAEEQQLTVEQAEALIQELFGIGYAAKTVASKVATPFKKAAGFVKGVGQRIGRAVGAVKKKSAEMDARAKAKYDTTKQAQAKGVEKARMKGAGEVSFNTRLQKQPKPATPTKTKPVAKPATKMKK